MGFPKVGGNIGELGGDIADMGQAIAAGDVGAFGGAAAETAKDWYKPLGDSDLLGAKKKDAEEKAKTEEQKKALEEKTAADEADIQSISDRQKDAAKYLAQYTDDAVKKVQETQSSVNQTVADAKNALGASKDAVKGQTDKIQKLVDEGDPTKVAAELVKLRNETTKEQMKLAQETLTQSQDLAKWYKGLATDYTDVATRYRDAVTGLTNDEKSKFKGEAGADYNAMSAVASQGAVNSFRGQSMTTGQQAAFMGVGQQAASSAYASAMDRMQNIDEQRRQMQFNIVNAASQQSLNSQIASGAGQQSALNLAGAARSAQAGYLGDAADKNAAMTYGANSDRFAQGMAGVQMTLGGIQQQAGYDTSIASLGLQGASLNRQSAMDIYGMKTDEVKSTMAADTYGGEARMAARAGTFAAGIGIDTMSQSRQAQNMANILGMVNAGAGAAAGGAKVAAAGGGGGAAAG